PLSRLNGIVSRSARRVGQICARVAKSRAGPGLEGLICELGHAGGPGPRSGTVGGAEPSAVRGSEPCVDMTHCADIGPRSSTVRKSRRVNTTAPIDALILMSFGGPEAPEEVVPFLRNVTAGRGIPEERLEEVGEHYFGFGGKSPINDQNRALLSALRGEL